MTYFSINLIRNLPLLAVTSHSLNQLLPKSKYLRYLEGTIITEDEAQIHIYIMAITFESVIDIWDTLIVCVLRGDWIDCRGASPTVLSL